MIFKLTKNDSTKIDRADLALISKYHWYKGNNGYVYGYLGNYRFALLHRFLLDPKKNQHVDHINGDKLDNRRRNLRVCTRSQNMKNTTKRKHNRSGYKWVSWGASNNGWCVRMVVGGKYIWGGQFRRKMDAVRRSRELALIHFGEFAKW